MKLSCLIGRHSPQPSAVKNQGLTFSRCAGCERDLVRSRGRWQEVPKGFRVVWRSADSTGKVAGAGPAPVPPAGSVAGEGTLAHLGMLGILAGAGLRALVWRLGDRISGLSRHMRIQRRPALLRLPAP